MAGTEHTAWENDPGEKRATYSGFLSIFKYGAVLGAAVVIGLLAFHYS